MRFRSATKDRAASFEALLPALKTAFQREQGAIRQAALNLALPPGNDLLKLRRDLLQHLSVAAGSLQTTGVAADDAMMRGVDGLNALAEAIPSIPDRLLRSRTEFLKLHQAQDAILLAVEQAIRSNETARRLPDLVDQQERLLAAFRALDLPGSNGRAEDRRSAERGRVRPARGSGLRCTGVATVGQARVRPVAFGPRWPRRAGRPGE